MNRILAESYFGGAFYASIRTENGFLFHDCTKHGNLDKQEFDRATIEPGPRDILIDYSQILSKELTVYSPYEQKYSHAVRGNQLILNTADGKTHTFWIPVKYGIPELRRFFALGDDQIQTHLSERSLEYGKALHRKEADQSKYVWGIVLCIALDLAVLIGAILLPYLPWLILGLIALVMPAILALVHPAWYTFTQRSGGSVFIYGKRMLPVHYLLYVAAMLLAIRLPMVSYLSTARTILIGALPMVLLAVVVWLLSRERSAAPGMRAAVLAMWIVFGAGVGLAVNAADFYCNPPDRTEICPIVTLEGDAERSGPPHYVTLNTEDGELRFHIDKYSYETMSVGDSVTVEYYDGTLGIPFVRFYEDGE